MQSSRFRSGWPAQHPHTRTEAPFIAVSKRRHCRAAADVPWLPQRQDRTCDTGTPQQQTAQHTRKIKQLIVHTSSCACCVPGSYCCRILPQDDKRTHTHASTSTHTQKHRSWLSEREKLEARMVLSRVWLAAAVVLTKQRCSKMLAYLIEHTHTRAKALCVAAIKEKKMKNDCRCTVAA